MLSIIGMVTGPLGKIAGIIALVGALGTAATVALHEYDNMIRAQLQASEQVKQIATMKADHAREIAALQSEAAAAATTATAMAHIRKNIDAAPPSTACAHSAAVRAAVDGLRLKSTPNH